MEPSAEVLAAGRGGRAGPRGRYGIDGGFAGLAVFGVVEAGLAGTVARAVRHRRWAVAALAGVGGAVVAGSAASYLYSTGPGKRAIWAQLLDELGLRGDEHVLDVGCGRGAVLMLAARRLPAGRAVGADVWRRRDQSGNSRAAAERNAAAEGVRGRVELADADARDLPFASASFDLVVSSLAISNIREAAGGRRRCARRCGSCGPAAGCVSSMTARAATPPCCGTPAVLTWPCGSWTGGPGTAYRAITSPWSQPPGHRLTPGRIPARPLSIGHSPVAQPSISVRDVGELLAGLLQLAGPLAGPAESAGGLAAQVGGRSTAGEVDVLAPVHPPRVGAAGVAWEVPRQLPEEPVHDLCPSAVPP